MLRWSFRLSLIQPPGGPDPWEDGVQLLQTPLGKPRTNWQRRTPLALHRRCRKSHPLGVKRSRALANGVTPFSRRLEAWSRAELFGKGSRDIALPTATSRSSRRVISEPVSTEPSELAGSSIRGSPSPAAEGIPSELRAGIRPD